MIVPISSQVAAVGAASAKFTNAMAKGKYYRLCSNTDCWYKVGPTGVAAAADTADSHFLAAGRVEYLITNDTTDWGFVAVIQEAAGGHASLSLVEGLS